MAEALQTPDRFAASYLEQLGSLASEMHVAIDAIAGNALSTLEESVARQEMLCAGLSSLAAVIGKNLNASGLDQLPSGLDSTVALRIRTATIAIHDLNLQYAALLKHSGKSIALLSALCKSHTGKSQEARGPRLKHQTWSCEM